ncbi:MAG TPA: DUF2182 domain-containing protein [Azospirillum sp.]|nr:DUF2182 domain-containing protein [Azospirillum sp.]
MTVLRRVLMHEKSLVVIGLLTVTLLSWLYLLAHVGMRMEPGMAMAAIGVERTVWSIPELAGLFVMWAVMMVAMMLPSAAPMILMFAGMQRKKAVGRPRDVTRAGTRIALFVGGYLAVWFGFSAGATLLQALLQSAALLSPTMASTSVALSGFVLIAAGFYHLTPLRAACLRQCRSPLDFVLHHWKPGNTGAFRMGLEHGAYCVGCCWMLMLLLFVGGVMNLLWIALITAYVAVEKIAPQGGWVDRLAAAALSSWGVLVIILA